MKIYDTDIRDAFFDEVYNIAKLDQQVIFLTDDMGAYSLVRFKKDFSNRYINVGIAEQNLISIAAGFALGGKKVFIYGIIPFLTLRCYEQIKVDLCCMNLPVTIVGVGTGLTYGSDGPTHHATSDIAVMRALPGMTILNSSDAICTKAFATIAYKTPSPTYVRLERGKLPRIYDEKTNSFQEGLAEIKEGHDLTIISTGVMVHQALKVSQILAKHSMSAGVVDLYRIKPLNEEMLLKIIDKSKHIITLEENIITGGIGSIVSEVLTDNNRDVPLNRIALPDENCFKVGDRESLYMLYKLDADNVVKTILGLCRYMDD